MKIPGFVLISLIILSCDGDSDSNRLSRIEENSYTGYVLYTNFDYDWAGRIIKITWHIDNDAPSIATISYDGNEAVIQSNTNSDPAYTQSKTVRLTLDANGLAQKRIEYTHRVSTSSASPGEGFIYDTLVYEYDADGFLKNYVRTTYDSGWAGPTLYHAVRGMSTGVYTMEAGNLTALDEYSTYPGFVRKGDITIYTGGSSEYHKVFSYAKSFPNKTDFRNAAVLNEYRRYHEAFLNRNYKNMPDQLITRNIDRDLNGVVIFDLGSTIDMERIYRNDGLLSSLKIPRGTQYRVTNYFYQ